MRLEGRRRLIKAGENLTRPTKLLPQTAETEGIKNN
jgi:hypothetical protein